MCEVVRSNFESKYSEIIQAISDASFIAVDTELTGLSIAKCSLFDSGEERYQVLRKCASSFLVCQIGLSMFIHVPRENRYEVACYNIYLFPSAKGVLDSQFSCQASSLEFLCEYNFDFNKFIYEGVPYLDKVTELALLDELENNSSSSSFNRAVFDNTIEEKTASVAEWLSYAKEGDTMEIETGFTALPYFIHSVLRVHFPTIWTSDLTDKKILVEIVSKEVRMEKQKTDILSPQEYVKSLTGFSRIFQYIVECKKPLVGHNLLLDLLMLYHRFQEPLPSTLKTFKDKFHQLFPVVFDTKHLAFKLRQQLEDCGSLLDGRSLHELYKNFSSPRGRFCALYSPSIDIQQNNNKYKTDHMIHEAGFDSYMAGYVFLRIAHVHALKNTRSTMSRSLTAVEHVQSLTSYANCVNVIRAQIKYLNICGEDPIPERPELMIVQSKEHNIPINLSEVTMLMCQFGSVDIKLRNRYQAVVAVGSFQCAREIKKAFHHHSTYCVSKYNAFRHSHIIQPLLWATAALSGGLGLWMLFSLIQQSRSK